MPVVAAENSTIAEHIRYRKPRQKNQQSIPDLDPIPSIIHSTRSKPTISSLLLAPFTPSTTANDQPGPSLTSLAPRKKNFTSSTFRGLGCTASSQVSVPAVIRTSADWDSSKKVKKKKLRSKKNSKGSSSGLAMVGTTSNNSHNNPLSAAAASSSSLPLSSSCVAVPDVWCGPGIGFTTDAASDCVVSRRPLSGRGKVDGDKILYRERSCSIRRMVTPEDIPFLDSETALTMPRSRLEAPISRHHCHARHGFPEGLAEIVMLQSSLLMGGRSDGHDRYRDWRLDVDNMSYEELLELGDRIGYVSTGLREDEINRCLRRVKLANMDLALHYPMEMERKCSVCQEEYETGDEMGKLDCGHFYHIHCIKQWLSQKNACPICKTAAVSQS